MSTRRPVPHRAGRRSHPDRLIRFSDTRGAVLIVALLIAALIAVGLASYLNLNLSSARFSKRTFNSYAALNLAETGVEEAVWSFNRTSASVAGAWDRWTTGTSTAAWHTFTGFDFGRNTTGSVKVYVDNHTPGPTTRPKIIAQSAIGSPGDTPVFRMIEVTLRRRSMFAHGLVARDKVVFSGAVTSVDAWNSDPDNDPATLPIPYDPARRTDRGTVASGATVAGSILINQANIWGYVATGGAPPQVGSLGSIRGPTTPLTVRIDPARVATDFNADFPTILAPTDGIHLASIPPVLGTVGTTTRWRCLSLALTGNATLTILGNVTLILTAGSGVDALSVTGNASIIIPEGSKFTVFVEGNVKIAGNGIANANPQPITFQLWGTNNTPGGQDIQVVGNGALKAALYAPNGNVTVVGNGDVMGSIVARSIRLAGNAMFHYDEALAYGEGNEPFAIARWRELTTAAERAAYRTIFKTW